MYARRSALAQSHARINWAALGGGLTLRRACDGSWLSENFLFHAAFVVAIGRGAPLPPSPAARASAATPPDGDSILAAALAFLT
jgi:hypothetical protein